VADVAEVAMSSPQHEHPRSPSAGSPSGRQIAVRQRTLRSVRGREARNRIMVSLTYVAAAMATIPLVLILVYLLRRGVSALGVEFFTSMPQPVGEVGGGMANAIVGTLMLIGVASALGLPIGVGAGLYLAEHRTGRLATVARFLTDVLNGLPSIVMGIFAWELLVRPAGHFSALAGGIALGAMMIPMVTRTTEEMVRLVPDALREAALALGYSRWRTSLAIVLRTAMGGIVTGALVAIARISGETAPLLFTAFGNQFWSTDISAPVAALPLQIFAYAISPYEEWHAQAWTGALVLVGIVFVISLVARIATRSRGGLSD